MISGVKKDGVGAAEAWPATGREETANEAIFLGGRRWWWWVGEWGAL